MLPLKELRYKPGHLLWRAQQLGWQLFGEEVRDFNITPVQEVVLFALRRRPNIDQKTLAQLVALDRSTTGDVVTRLEQRGFLSRVPHEADKRAWSLALTPAGEAFAESLVPIARKAANRLLAILSPRERDEFMRILRKIVGLADQVDLQEVSAFQKDRLAEKLIVTFSQDTLRTDIASRLTAEGADIQNISVSKSGVKSIEKELRQITRSRRPDAIIMGGDSAFRATSAFDNYDAIKNEIQIRSFILAQVCKLNVDSDYLRVVNICHFPSSRSDEDAMNGAFALNSALLAMTERYRRVSLASGVSIASLSPSILTANSAQSSNSAAGYARVSDTDLASCAAFLISNESRAIVGSNIQLGVAE